jgi:hypothetical protein
VFDVCTALHITCHYDQDKPEWMDGGVTQEEMAEILKREVEEKAHRRRGERAAHNSGGRASVTTSELIMLPHDLSRDLATPTCNLLKATSNIPNDEIEPCPQASAIRLQRGSDCTLISKNARESIAFGRFDSILLMFYLNHLLSFLFPIYRLSLIQGGRTWMLEMMISSPVVRQAILCQGSYFFSLAREIFNRDAVWEAVLTQTFGY